jgi:polyhydroxyalkanoate synthesis regulator phasin
MSEEQQRKRPGIGEGIRTGIGVLTAFKEAVEETLQEAVERGDLKPERAKQALTDALSRAQDAVGDVRERLDFVSRKEFDELRAEVAELRRRLDGGGAPTLLSPPTGGDRPGGEGPLEQRMP